LLALHADRVWSVEIVPELAKIARENLLRQNIARVSVETGDATLGWPAHAPYDVIMVSGSLPLLPKQLLAQLKVGGRLFAIVGEAPVMTAQLLTRTGEDSYHSENLFETEAPPLVNAPRPDRFVF
jgi:protein-L-isoaspartate(D-aspartate) O-methyltransferase